MVKGGGGERGRVEYRKGRDGAGARKGEGTRRKWGDAGREGRRRLLSCYCRFVIVFPLAAAVWLTCAS